jgi:hypothetical protein
MTATMDFMTRMFAVRAMHSQRDVRERAAQVIDRVIFDLGVDRFVQGTFRLDRHCRPRFSSAAADPGRDGVAVVLAGLPECAALRAVAYRDADPQVMRLHTAAVVDALLREFRAGSARFRALPAVPAGMTAGASEAVSTAT